MFLLTIIYRKIYKNKGLYAFLFLGILTLTILMSSIPMFTEGLLNRLLLKDLENYQKSTYQYPGNYTVNYQSNYKDLDHAYSKLNEGENSGENPEILSVYKKRFEEIKNIGEVTETEIVTNFKVPVTKVLTTYTLEGRYIRETDPDNSGQYFYHGYGHLKAIKDFEKHITIISGRLPNESPQGNIYEVMLTENIIKKYQFELNKIYELTDVRENGLTPIKIIPVCVFDISTDDVFWTGINKDELLSESFMLDYNILERDFINKEPCLVDSVEWNYSFDYHVFKITNLDLFLNGCKENDLILKDIFPKITTTNSIENITDQYFNKKSRMEILLWTLYTPVIILLLLYLLMMCNAIVEREKNEIAVLNSRGATRFQIVADYIFQALFLCMLSMLTGPPLGRIMTSFLGSTTSFLQFGNNEPLFTHLGLKSYLYGAGASLIFLTLFGVYVFFNSKVNIVSHKRNLVRKKKKALWQKLFIDIFLFIIVGIGYSSFIQKMSIALKAGGYITNDEMDPLLFLAPVLFILAAFLFVLRIYPFVINKIYLKNKSRLSANLYISLLQVSRSVVGYHFILVFMVVTLAIGLFSSISIRTINTNASQRILYKNGSDFVLKYSWDVIPQVENEDLNIEITDEYRPVYDEPDFSLYSTLPGVISASKVFTDRGCSIIKDNVETKNVDVMGIDPQTFAKTAWFKDGLLTDSLDKYIAPMISNEDSCIISSSLSSVTGLKKGDYLEFHIMNEASMKLHISDVVNYWPTFNPNKLTVSNNSLQKLIIVSVNSLQKNYGTRPYDVWLNTKENISSDTIIEQIKKSKIKVTSIKNSVEEIFLAITNPYQTAVNGAFTFGFIICSIICIMGFLLFWTLEIKSRVIQYGVFRAIGLGSKDLMKILAWEQVLTSGLAILCGTVFGILTSFLFVPFFQLGFNVSQLVPPFEIIVLRDDILRILAISTVSIFILFMVLVFLMHSFKIDRALKLGEE